MSNQLNRFRFIFILTYTLNKINYKFHLTILINYVVKSIIKIIIVLMKLISGSF